MRKATSLILALGLAAPALGHYNVSAERVLDASYVENPSYALGVQDGKFAEISYLGSLELELSDVVKDAKGTDLTIVSRTISEEREPMTQTYEVWGKKEAFDSWTKIGQNKPGYILGEAYSGAVDISPLEEVKYVKIKYANPYFHTAVPRIEKNVVGIDSVEGKN